MTLAELLALLARWAELDEAEQASLNEAMTPEFISGLSTGEGGEREALRAALTEAADAALDQRDDQALEALDWIAATIESVSAADEADDAAEVERDRRAEELRERIHGSDDTPPEGDPAAAPADAAAGDEADPDAAGGDAGGEPAPAEGADPVPAEAEHEAQPVAAAAGRVPPGRARRPAATARPAVTQARAAITAAAGVPGVAAGAPLTLAGMGQAIAATLDALPPGSLRDGFVIPFAQARAVWPEESFLDGDARSNARKLNTAFAPQAIAAAGGICAPQAPRYDLPQISVTDRPVKASLVRFGADRGGVLLPPIPEMADVTGSIGVWTEADDRAAADDPDMLKACMFLDCGGDDVPVLIDAITKCFEIGNFNARTWPERVDRFMSLSDAWMARVAERKLLTAMGALSKHVTAPQVLGTARDVLTNLDLGIAGLRSAYRMSLSQPLHFTAPAWLLAQMRADLARELPGATAERLAVTDQEIATFFAVRNVNITWALDGETGQEFAIQTNNQPLQGWPADIVTYLYPEGMFLLLDGGELNFSLTRDNLSNSRNNFRMQLEIFENVAKFGAGDAWRFVMTTCPDGSTSATVALDCPDSRTS